MMGEIELPVLKSSGLSGFILRFLESDKGVGWGTKTGSNDVARSPGGGMGSGGRWSRCRKWRNLGGLII